jgi:hypothetical protein
MYPETKAAAWGVMFDAQARKMYLAKASAWVQAQSHRLNCEPSDVLRASTCAILADDIERCGSNLAFLTLCSGRTPKIIKPGRYEGHERDRLSGYRSFADTQAQQAQEQRGRPRRRAA